MLQLTTFHFIAAIRAVFDAVTERLAYHTRTILTLEITRAACCGDRRRVWKTCIQVQITKSKEIWLLTEQFMMLWQRDSLHYKWLFNRTDIEYMCFYNFAPLNAWFKYNSHFQNIIHNFSHVCTGEKNNNIFFIILCSCSFILHVFYIHVQCIKCTVTVVRMEFFCKAAQG